MKPKKNIKKPDPFSGKPVMGPNLANAVGNIYNLEEELKELEKPLPTSNIKGKPLNKAFKPTIKNDKDSIKNIHAKSPSKSSSTVNKLIKEKTKITENKAEEEVKLAEKLNISISNKEYTTNKTKKPLLNLEKMQKNSIFYF